MHRCDNLFKDLDSRALTSAEESIIAQRVALQRRMLEEYEKREKARKVLLSCSTVKCTSLPISKTLHTPWHLPSISECYLRQVIIKQVKELRAICPDLTEEEALCALKLHKDRWGLSSFLMAHPQHLLSVHSRTACSHSECIVTEAFPIIREDVAAALTLCSASQLQGDLHGRPACVLLFSS